MFSRPGKSIDRTCKFRLRRDNCESEKKVSDDLQTLLKDTVLLGAALFTLGDSLMENK
jgi:hypothetical protein